MREDTYHFLPIFSRSKYKLIKTMATILLVQFLQSQLLQWVEKKNCENQAKQVSDAVVDVWFCLNRERLQMFITIYHLLGLQPFLGSVILGIFCMVTMARYSLFSNNKKYACAIRLHRNKEDNWNHRLSTTCGCQSKRVLKFRSSSNSTIDVYYEK